MILKCIYTSASTINNGLLRKQDMEYRSMSLNPGDKYKRKSSFSREKANMNKKLLLYFKKTIIESTLIQKRHGLEVLILSYPLLVN